MKIRLRLLLSDLLMLLGLMAALICPVLASENSRTIELQFPEDAAGGSIEILQWKPDPVTEENITDLQDSEWIRQAQKEASSIAQSSILNGRAEFSNLEPGIYLVVQPEPCDGYRIIDPFLIDLRNDQDGIVDAEPKMAKTGRQPGQASARPADKRAAMNHPDIRTAIFSIPQVWTVLILGAGLFLICLSKALCRKKK